MTKRFFVLAAIAFACGVVLTSKTVTLAAFTILPNPGGVVLAFCPPPALGVSVEKALTFCAPPPPPPPPPPPSPPSAEIA